MPPPSEEGDEKLIKKPEWNRKKPGGFSALSQKKGPIPLGYEKEDFSKDLLAKEVCRAVC